MWETLSDAEARCREVSERARGPLTQSALLTERLPTRDAEGSNFARQPRRRWLSFALGLAVFAATAVLIGAILASVARTPGDDAGRPQLDEGVVPGHWGPFLP